MMKTFLILKLCFLLAFLPLRAWSATRLVFDTKGNIIGSYVDGNATSYNKMQATLSGVYYKKAGDMGYTPVAQADGSSKWAPAVSSTLASVSGVAGGTAASVTGALLAGATAPGWVGVAIVAGVSAAVGFAVTFALNGLAKWLFNSDGTIDESSDQEVVLDPSNGISAGGTYWKASDQINFVYGGDGASVASQALANIRARAPNNQYPPISCVQNSATQWQCGSVLATKANTGAPATCPKNSYYYSGSCKAYNYMPTSAVPTKTGVSLQTAIADLPASDLAKPVNPVLVAAVANQLWKQAASQPGYAGLPYSYSNPITEADVTSWQQQNPDQYPSGADFVAPQSDAGAWTLPVSGQPIGSGTGTPSQPVGTVNPAASQAQVNLGPDPSIGAPQLEAPPTAAQILAPILGLLPDLRSFNAGSHTAVCPKPTLNLFGETQTMEAHCTLLDDNKPVIQAAMALSWALLALVIILSA
jgi:hypothetical protein